MFTHIAARRKIKTVKTASVVHNARLDSFACLDLNDSNTEAFRESRLTTVDAFNSISGMFICVCVAAVLAK